MEISLVFPHFKLYLYFDISGWKKTSLLLTFPWRPWKKVPEAPHLQWILLYGSDIQRLVLTYTHFVLKDCPMPSSSKTCKLSGNFCFYYWWIIQPGHRSKCYSLKKTSFKNLQLYSKYLELEFGCLQHSIDVLYSGIFLSSTQEYTNPS